MRKHTKRILPLLLALVLCLGLLPATAIAAEDDGEFTITFDASPGKFPDGSTTKVARTFSNLTNISIITDNRGQNNNAVHGAAEASSASLHLVEIPAETPVLEGYTFAGWYVDSPNEYPSVANRSFTADTTVKANWTKNAGDGGEIALKLYPNGGTVNPDYFIMDENYKVVGKLPIPTRPGYTFKGWYIDGKLLEEGKPFITTARGAEAQWERSSKVTPTVSASPAQIEAGAEKVEVTLSCPSNGAMLDWRPFERVLFGGNGGNPADVEGAVKQYINGNNPNGPSGLKLTDIRYEGSYDFDESAYPHELYPEGVCPVPQLVLTFEGKAAAGETLYIYMEPGCFVQPVTKNEHLVLTESSAQIFEGTKLSIPITGTAASSNGPFTVKFDLNYKNAKESEIPKEQKIAKGQTVDLPDGTKLTPPFSNYEFHGWCMKGEDGKLYPWAESATVTADITLYADWGPKGTAGQPSAPAQTAAPKFTDVAAASPFAPAISWAVEKKITNGTTPTTFSPGTTCTRGHILTFLWRSQGSPEPTIANPYRDTISSAFQKAAVWAHEKGLVSGDTFGSTVACTRASAVTYMWKLAGSPEAKAASFTDVAASSDYAKAISWAVEQGVTNGTGDGTTFSPDATCTRGQIVTFLYRAYEK